MGIADEHIPGFNQRSQQLNDLYLLCEPRMIEVVERPMRVRHGFAFYDEGFPYIYINSLLPAGDQIVAGFHEYFHIVGHAPDTRVFESAGAIWNKRKYERQAQTVGVIALMPITELQALEIKTAPELMEFYQVSHKTAEFRVRVLSQFGI